MHWLPFHGLWGEKIPHWHERYMQHPAMSILLVQSTSNRNTNLQLAWMKPYYHPIRHKMKCIILSCAHRSKDLTIHTCKNFTQVQPRESYYFSQDQIHVTHECTLESEFDRKKAEADKRSLDNTLPRDGFTALATSSLNGIPLFGKHIEFNQKIGRVLHNLGLPLSGLCLKRHCTQRQTLWNDASKI